MSSRQWGSWRSCCSIEPVGRATPSRGSTQGPDGRSNILVIVLDDIGIDQWGIEPFGWTGVGGAESPNLPVLQSIADQGVSFTNFWATPEVFPDTRVVSHGSLLLPDGCRHRDHRWEWSVRNNSTLRS